MSKFNFQDASPDLVMDAIESVGIYPESGLTALNSYENRVYQFKAEDQQRYVIKLYRPQRWNKEQLIEEHQYSQYLLDNHIAVGTPLIINQHSLHEWQGYYFCIYPSLGGRMFEVDNLDQLEWLGRILGRMHLTTKQVLFEHRPTININEDISRALTELEQCELIPSSLKTTFFHDANMMAKLCESTVHQTYSTIKLHGDCHPGNILWQAHNSTPSPVLVDFDDCLNGPAIQDLWMMLNGDRSSQMLQMDALLAGYEEFSEFDKSQLALIEPLRARRIILYMAWIAKRWADPAFKINFAWFDTEKYWEQQVLTIKEQISLLSEPPLQIN